MVVLGWIALACRLMVMTPLGLMTPDQLITSAVWVRLPALAMRLLGSRARLTGRVSVSSVANGLITEVLVRVMV